MLQSWRPRRRYHRAFLLQEEEGSRMLTARATETTLPMHILAVDDDALIRMVMIEFLTGCGHKVTSVENGLTALDCLEKSPVPVDVILMDNDMPVMDGLSTVRHLKDNPDFAHIPIIMITGTEKPEYIQACVEAGVFYCLTKPFHEKILCALLSAALREQPGNPAVRKDICFEGFQLIQHCDFQFQTLAQAESLSECVSQFFPDAARVTPGLDALFVNALEHGNLGIGFDGKAALIRDGCWRQEIERLQTLPENCEKYVTVEVAHDTDNLSVAVTDMGAGFDWPQYMAQPGHGIARASTQSFDRLTYNDKGNQVVGVILT